MNRRAGSLLLSPSLWKPGDTTNGQRPERGREGEGQKRQPSKASPLPALRRSTTYLPPGLQRPLQTAELEYLPRSTATTASQPQNTLLGTDTADGGHLSRSADLTAPLLPETCGRDTPAATRRPPVHRKDRDRIRPRWPGPLRNIRNMRKLRIMHNTRRVNSTELSRDTRELLDHVKAGGRVQVERYGQPVTVMVPIPAKTLTVDERIDLYREMDHDELVVFASAVLNNDPEAFDMAAVRVREMRAKVAAEGTSAA